MPNLIDQKNKYFQELVEQVLSIRGTRPAMGAFFVPHNQELKHLCGHAHF